MSLNNELALFGGTALIKKALPKYNTIGKEETRAVARVVKTGKLSGFLGSNSPGFFGGQEVKSFEKQFKEKFGFKYAVAVNSATSGLFMAIGALGLGPSDEVIVSPYSMCCSATAPLLYGAIPVFCDIEKDSLCLDPQKLKKLITKNTKAIILVQLMGNMAKMREICALAKKRNIYIIEDAAQAMGAKYNNRFAGSFSDIAVFSFNFHKIVQTGEGGVCCAKNEEIYKRLCLIRNHAEAVIAGGFAVNNLNNMLGFNFRLGEMEAAIAKEQLKKLDGLIKARQDLAFALTSYLSKIPQLILPRVKENISPTWYSYCLRLKPGIGVTRDIIALALAKEGVPVVPGYVQPLYLMPILQKKTFLKNGNPFSLPENVGLNQSYQKGICPVCEQLEKEELLQVWGMRPPLTKTDMKNFALAFKKVFANLQKLKDLKLNVALPKDSAGRRQVFN